LGNAYDISLLSESEGELQHLVDRVSQTSTRFGLIVSKPKTEVQCIGKNRQQMKIMLEDEELKQVENFVYLGGSVSADQSSDKDIERRIGLAAGIVRNLDTIWKATKGTKVMLYHTLVQAIVLYNAETWTLKEEHKRKLRVFEMSVLRRICGITRRDRRRNVDIKQELDVKLDIVQRLQRRLTYFGHVARVNNSRYANILLHGYGSGQRTRGRPKKKWVDNIKEDCTEIGITINEVMTLTGDRNTCRSTVLNLGCQRAETTSSSPRHEVK